jgi:hypothetical protein
VGGEDAMVVAGAALLSFGLVQIYWPLVPILLGAALVAAGLWLALR